MKVLCPIDPVHITSAFSSHQDLRCRGCKAYHPWPRNEEQPPLITCNRDTRGKQ